MRGPTGMGRTRSKDDRWFYAYLPNGMAGGATSPLIPLFTRILGGSVADVGAVAAASSLASGPPFLGWGREGGPFFRGGGAPPPPRAPRGAGARRADGEGRAPPPLVRRPP